MVRVAQKLLAGTLVTRPNRFVGEVLLDGEKIICHIPNPGRMVGFLFPGAHVFVEERISPKRKLDYTMLYVKQEDVCILINSILSNKIIQEALERRQIAALAHVQLIQPEQKYGAGNHSRIDFLLDKRIFVEVKATNHMEHHIGYFPDAPSLRAQRHLTELIEVLKQNPKHESFVIFLVQRTDITEVRPFDTIDPKFGRLLREAAQAGVQLLAHQIQIRKKGLQVSLGKEIPVVLPEL